MLAMPALRRPGLLISAVLAITVPGVLAIVALLGPDHTAARATAFAGAGAGEAAAGSGELYDYAETAQDGMGIQLLGESAAAGLAVSYQGVELLVAERRWTEALSAVDTYSGEAPCRDRQPCLGTLAVPSRAGAGRPRLPRRGDRAARG